MNEKSIRSWDISLPLMGLIAVALIVLSGCNLNTSDQASSGTVGHSGSGQVAMAAAPSQPVVKQASYSAGKLNKFSQASYEQALADNKTVLLDFHADWCAVCVNNAPKIEEAFNQLNDQSVVGFKVNYDTEKALKRQFSVNSQSTFIVLKGGKEVARTMGPQTAISIKALLSV